MGDKWANNFVLRNGLRSTTLHGEAGSVDPEAIEEGMAAIREMCKEYKVENVFNIDETGIFYKLLPNRTYLSKGEK